MPTVAATSGNWIPDQNRFNLPKPPAWFLKVLWDQDAGLVIVPSRQARKYLLTRRRELSRRVFDLSRAAAQLPLARGGDAAMLEQYGLLKVDAIGGNVYHGSWMRSCPAICAELRSRDLWARGGADKFANDLDTQEQEARDRQRAGLLDDIDHRARDAWRSYQARTGQRTRVAPTSRTARAVHASQ